MARDKLPPPPSSITGELGEYLGRLYSAVNQTPSISYVSTTNPNSAVTGFAGDILVNVGSASTSTRLWLKASGVTVPDKTNWVMVRIAT